MNVFSTGVLTGVVNSLQVSPQFLLDKFFPTVQTESSEEIHFDMENDVMGLAPFVLPVVEGQLIAERGYVTKTFKPAYIKPKHAFEPQKALKRAIGEPLLGTFSPEDRARRLVAQDLSVQRTIIERRLEWMASQVIRTGSVTISGDKYPTSVVSFGRDAALTVTVTGTAQWDDVAANPLGNLESWANLVYQKSGSWPTDVIMDKDAWSYFRANSSVISIIDRQRDVGMMPSLNENAPLYNGGRLAGTVIGFNIWVYVGYYKDDVGVMTPYLPSGTVLMLGDLMGVRAFGAIQDEEAGIQAVPMFSKSWLVPDPGRRFIMTQSAPLVVPYRVNASLCATVL